MARKSDIRLRRSAVSGSIPTTSNLNLGELALNTADGKVYMKKSVGGTDTVIEVGAGGGISSSFIAYEYTATANQTTFSGTDNNSNTLAYNTGTPPSVQVFMNGILLDEGSSQDYTGTNGTSVVLSTAADAGDLIQIHAYKSDVSIVSNLNFNDNQKLQFGDSQDLQIYHDGSNSIISDVGTGHLQLRGANTYLQNADGTANYLVAIQGDETKLYFNNSAKIATTSTGIDVTGNVVATGDIIAADSNSSTTPSITFTGHTNTGLSVYQANSVDRLSIITGGAQRANFGTHGVESFANVYTGNTSSFRNYAGTWSATTGVTGNGFNFINSVDGTALTLSSGGNAVFAGTISSGTITSSGDVRADTHFNSTDTNATLSATGSGNVYLRPNGKSSTSGQVHIATSGDATFAGKITSPELEITGGAGNVDLYITNTSPTLGFTDTNSFTDANDIYIIRGLNNAIGMQWYDNSANTTTTTFEIDSAGNTDITGSLTATGLDINGNADISGILTMSNSAASNRLDMNNNNIIGVNSLVFADPGPQEGLSWSNIKIFESPDDLTTNSAGNLQVTYSNTRKLTVSNNGIDVNGSITTSGTLYGPSSFTIDPAGHDDNTGTVIIAGNLQVDGTTTTINSTTLDVDDLNITLAKGTTSAGGANGAGILVEGPSGGGAKLVYESSNDRWTLNKEVFSSQGFMIGTTATDVGLIKNSSGVFDFQAQTNREISFSNVTNGEHVRIDADGNVGIGTTTPATKLHIKKASAGTTHFDAYATAIIEDTEARLQIISDDGGNNASSILLSNENKHWAIMHQGPLSNNRFSIGYDLTTATGTDIVNTSSHIFNITTDGNVGIGTSSPSSVLDVAGSAAVLTITDTRDQTFTVGDTMCSLAFDSDDTSGGAGTASHPRALISLVAETTFGSSTGLSFSTKQDTTTAPTEKMRISTAGNVGIGTTSPGYKLDVNGTIRAQGAITSTLTSSGGTFLSIGHSGNENWSFDAKSGSGSTDYVDFGIAGGTRCMTWQEDGNVGIGTTAPDAKLRIDQDATAVGLKVTGGNSGYNIAEFVRDIGSNTTVSISGYSGNPQMQFVSTGNTFAVGVRSNSFNIADHSYIDGTNIRLAIDNTGRVGIGVDAPLAQLQVKQLGINVNQSSVTSTSQYTCDSMSATAFRSSRYTVQITNTTDSTYQITEILLIHDGTTPSMTEYGTIFTGSAVEATFDADIVSGNVRLLATPASTDSMQFKVVRHSILV